MARLPIPWSKYDSTRVDSSEQRTVNMYPHSARGYRQAPGLEVFASAPGVAPDGDSKDISANTTLNFSTPVSATSMVVTANGQNLYVVDGATNIDWYTMTANDITSLSYQGSLATGGTAVALMGVKADGSEIFFSDKSGGNFYIYGWTLSTPYDITTGSLNQTSTLNYSSSKTYAHGQISADGTAAYLDISGTINIYSMTAYDLSTLSLDDTNPAWFDVATVQFVFDDAVENLYTCLGSKNIERYELSVPGDASSSIQNISVLATTGTNHEVDGAGIALINSDTQLLAGQSTTDTIRSFEILSTGTARGGINMGGTLYAVLGSALYCVASNGNATYCGTIAGSERVVMETDGTQLVITTGSDGGTIYRYTDSGGLDTVTDADVEDTAKSSAYLDLAFYLDQSAGRVIASANNDATIYDTDDRIEAESFSDNVLRAYAHNQLLYLFGETTVEIFYTSGVGRPPIERQQVVERGIVGTHAISSIDDTIFFVDQFRRPNIMSGLEYRPIYKSAVAEAWDTYSTDSDCFVSAYSYRQQSFVDFVFPSDNKSWTYHVNSGEWLEREDTSNDRSRAAEYVNVYSKLIVLDRSNSRFYELSETAYQDEERTNFPANITRTKDTAIVTTEIFGEASIYGEEMICNSLKITAESTGAATLNVSLSKDGNAFGQTRTLTLTDGRQTRELNQWGKFREGIWRITTTSNAGVDLVDISADLEILSG